MDDLKTVVAYAGGWLAGWLAPDRTDSGGWDAGEIPAGFGPDAVTPAGATIPSWRVSVVSTPHLPPHAGGNPRIRPGSSVVGVAFLLEGVAWCASVWDAGCMVVILRRVQRLSVFLSSLICRCRHLFLIFSSCFSFGLFCTVAPASWMYRVFAL